jgi:hypothetical protein
MGGNVIEISATFTFSSEVTRGDQVGHDSLRPAFRDVQHARNVTKANSRILRNQEERVAVIGQKAKVWNPVLHFDIPPLISSFTPSSYWLLRNWAIIIQETIYRN